MSCKYYFYIDLEINKVLFITLVLNKVNMHFSIKEINVIDTLIQTTFRVK